MSVQQWRKLDVVQRVERGELTVSEAALALGMSRRQMQRLRKKVKQEGHSGVVHGNAGRAPKHKTAALVAQRIVAFWRSKYLGFNDQHFTEKLREVEGLAISRETVRRILRGAGLGPARQRRSQKHRRRRDRRPQAGQMILWDGSRHDWLEGRGPPMCLMGAIDDATGELLPGAHFVDQECSIGYLRVLRDIVLEKGVPLSAYMDRHGALKRNDNQRQGGDGITDQLRGDRITDLRQGAFFRLTDSGVRKFASPKCARGMASPRIGARRVRGELDLRRELAPLERTRQRASAAVKNRGARLRAWNHPFRP